MTAPRSTFRPRKRVIIAIALGVPLVFAAVWLVMDWYEHSTRPKFVPPPRHSARLVLDPPQVDLGRRSQCDGLVRVKGTIRNASNEPTVLQDWFSSCGCTAPSGSIQKGMILAPGESADFEVSSDAWAISGEKNYTVDFIEQFADAPVRFVIKYIVESPLYTDVGYLTRMVDAPSSVKVMSRDKQPFRVLAIEPAITVDFDSSVASAEHALVIDWTKADAVLGTKWREQELQIKTDRAECPVLYLRMQSELDVDIGKVVPEVIPD